MKIQHRVLAVLAMIVAAAMLTLATATPAYAMSKGDPAYDVIVMILTVYMVVSPLVIVALIVLLIRANKKAKSAASETILPSAQRAQAQMSAAPVADPYAGDPYADFDTAPAPRQQAAPTARQQAAAQRKRPAQASGHGRVGAPAQQPQQRPQQSAQAAQSAQQRQAQMRQAQAQRQAQARAAQQQTQQGQARPRVHIDPNGAGGQRRM